MGRPAHVGVAEDPARGFGYRAARIHLQKVKRAGELGLRLEIDAAAFAAARPTETF
jgi:hypothetical protein